MRIVGQAELNGEYQRLRGELDAAYQGPVWNSTRIDRIAEEIAQIEYALASFQSGSRFHTARGLTTLSVAAMPSEK